MADKIADTTALPPWTWNSTTSSPVKLFGSENYNTYIILFIFLQWLQGKKFFINWGNIRRGLCQSFDQKQDPLVSLR